jgi:signal transduction histidine kinase
MKQPPARAIARTLIGLLLALLVVTLWLTSGDETTQAQDVPFILIFAFGMLAFGAIGALLAVRTPSNPVGWLLLGVGLLLLFGVFLEEYALRGSTDLSLPAVGWAGMLNMVVFAPSVAMIVLALLLFPQGRLPSRRWRVVVWILAVGTVTASLWNVVQPDPILIAEDLTITNPLAVPALKGIRWVITPAVALIFLAFFLSLVSIVVRFRSSEGEERQQLRWLSFASLLVVGSVVALFVVAGLTGDQSTWSTVAFVLTGVAIFVALPGSIAVAILRYRLYDLDLVIKKTVIFGITVVLTMAVTLAFLFLLSAPLTDRAPDETITVGVTMLVIGFLVWPTWHLARCIGDRLVYGGRATPYEALTEFSGRLSEAYATDDILPRMAAILGESTRAAEARVWLRIGATFRPAAPWPEASTATIEDVRATGDTMPALPGDQAVEVHHRGELLGALSVVSRANDPVGSDRVRLMHDLAAQAGLVLRNVRLIEELRASRQRLVAAQDQERRKLERDIHDGAQQQLVALGVKLRLTDSLIERDPAKAHEMVQQLQTETQSAIDDLRDLARGIYPPLLADQGLAAALEAQARKSPVPVEVSADAVERLPQQLEAAVYFSCLEALQNMAKYADASHATVSLVRRDDSLEFSVYDDGRGFDVSATSHGSGLQGIADRLDAIGGTMRIESVPGGGTTLVGLIPTEPTG